MTKRALLLLALMIGCSHAAAPQPTVLSSKAPPDPLDAYVGVWLHADPKTPETLTIKAGGTFEWVVAREDGGHCTIAGRVAYAEVAPGEATPGYNGPDPGDDDGDHDYDDSEDVDENPCDGGEGESAMNLAQMPGESGVGVGGSLAKPRPPAPADGAKKPQLIWTMTTNECNDSYQGRTTGDWVVHIDADHLGLSDADPMVEGADTVEYTRQR
jgi:hypothetical protein